MQQTKHTIQYNTYNLYEVAWLSIIGGKIAELEGLVPRVNCHMKLTPFQYKFRKLFKYIPLIVLLHTRDNLKKRIKLTHDCGKDYEKRKKLYLNQMSQAIAAEFSKSYQLDRKDLLIITDRIIKSYQKYII